MASKQNTRVLRRLRHFLDQRRERIAAERLREKILACVCRTAPEARAISDTDGPASSGQCPPMRGGNR